MTTELNTIIEGLHTSGFQVTDVDGGWAYSVTNDATDTNEIFSSVPELKAFLCGVQHHGHV